MSRDIRSFFSVSPKKFNSSKNPVVPKRKAPQISSDDEVVPVTPTEKGKIRTNNKKRRVTETSNSESSQPKILISPKPNLAKLKEKNKTKLPAVTTDFKALFSDVPKRTERKKTAKVVPNVVDGNDIVLLSDEEFDEDLKQLDIPGFLAVDRGETNSKISPLKFASKAHHRIDDSNANGSPTDEQPTQNIETPEKKKDSREKCLKNESPQKESLRDLGLTVESSEELNKNSKKKSMQNKNLDLESSVLSDEQRHEQRQRAIVLFHQYKNRPSALKHGSKEIPKGDADCLKGLTFVVTGVLESMEREEACNLIKELGGKVSTTVGKRLNFMVVGEDAGPKKLATAEELGIKILNEDGLLDLIKSQCASKGNHNYKNTSSPNKKSLETPKHATANESANLRSTPSKIPNNLEKLMSNRSPVKRKYENENDAKSELIKKTKTESPKNISSKIEQTKEQHMGLEDTKEISVGATGEMLAWVDKYKPTNIKQIIGQQGPGSNSAKLLNWLKNWFSNHDGKKKLQKPNPWSKNDDGSFYKAALLSGPPGIGKTTTANLVCKELGFDAVEFNASDTRSKKMLKEEVSELLSNKSLFGYFHGTHDSVSKKHVLIMDEVDGMAGNEDRGGVQELIGLIKDSSVPIICMCNDRNHQKMRSLVNYCYDLRFNKPRLEQIKGAIMSICFKEKLKIAAGKINEIIVATNNDIRQTINHLSLLSGGKDLNLDKCDNERTAEKDLKMGPWEVVRKVFATEGRQHMNMNDKSDLFFHDYSLGPLFVQQNYLSVAPSVPKAQVVQQVALAADSLSLGDLIDKRIRSSSAWTLLPVQAIFSSVMPGEYMQGHFTGQINFPGWLGKYSKSNKRNRLAQEIHDHTRARTSGSRRSIRMDYAPFLLDAIVRPLQNKGLEGVQQSLEIIKEYRLLREDIESLIELSSWPGKKNPMDLVDSKVKAALTRTYNKEVMPYSYSAICGIKKRKGESLDTAELDDLNSEDNDTVLVAVSDDEDDEKIENDTLIKAKKKSTQTLKDSQAKEIKNASSSTKKSKAPKAPK